MRYYPQELMIMRLRGTVPGIKKLDWVRAMSEQEAIDKLKLLTGQDFGRGANAWQRWFSAEQERLEKEDASRA